MTTTTLTTPRRRVLVPPLPRAGTLAVVVAASLLIALLAHVRLALPFTPVPVTGQTLGVLLVAAALGSRRGTAAVLAYLAEGAVGLPVFAGGSGLAYLLGPTGGYLLGFLAAAWVVGKLAERGRERSLRTAWLAFLAGEAVIYAFGVPWLGLYVGFSHAIALGFAPFLLGDLLKALLAGLLLPTTWHFRQ